MSQGPIPWSSIMAYATVNGFDANELLEIIRATDAASNQATQEEKKA